MSIYYYGDSLEHHGIKGQKWGVRRYQNPDGSLTEAGKRRYNIQTARGEYKKAKSNYHGALLNDLGLQIRQNRQRYFGKGYLGQSKDRIDSKRNLQTADFAREDAKAVLAKAKYGDRGELIAYRNAFNRQAREDRNTEYYDYLVSTKGREYADKVLDSVDRHNIDTAAVMFAVRIGEELISALIKSKTNANTKTRPGKVLM